MDVAYFRSLARYNRWANRRLYDAVARLSPEEFARPRRAYFASIRGTLNHILVGDRIWLGRAVGRPEALHLDQTLFEAFAPLRAAREAWDERFVAELDAIDEGRLAGDLAYADTRGQPFVAPLKFVLGHMVNHQTHHRGQAHDLLSQTDVPPPAFDLIFYLRETAA